MENVHKDREKALQELNALIYQSHKPSLQKELLGKVSSLWSRAKKGFDEP